MSKYDLTLIGCYCFLPTFTVMTIDGFNATTFAGILAGINLGMFLAMIGFYAILQKTSWK